MNFGSFAGGLSQGLGNLSDKVLLYRQLKKEDETGKAVAGLLAGQTGEATSDGTADPLAISTGNETPPQSLPGDPAANTGGAGALSPEKMLGLAAVLAKGGDINAALGLMGTVEQMRRQGKTDERQRLRDEEEKRRWDNQDARSLEEHNQKKRLWEKTAQIEDIQRELAQFATDGRPETLQSALHMWPGSWDSDIQLGEDGSYSVALSNGATHQFKDKGEVLAALRRVVNPAEYLNHLAAQEKEQQEDEKEIAGLDKSGKPVTMADVRGGKVDVRGLTPVDPKDVAAVNESNAKANYYGLRSAAGTGKGTWITNADGEREWVSADETAPVYQKPQVKIDEYGDGTVYDPMTGSTSNIYTPKRARELAEADAAEKMKEIGSAWTKLTPEKGSTEWQAAFDEALLQYPTKLQGHQPGEQGATKGQGDTPPAGSEFDRLALKAGVNLAGKGGNKQQGKGLQVTPPAEPQPPPPASKKKPGPGLASVGVKAQSVPPPDTRFTGKRSEQRYGDKAIDPASAMAKMAKAVMGHVSGKMDARKKAMLDGIIAKQETGKPLSRWEEEELEKFVNETGATGR